MAIEIVKYGKRPEEQKLHLTCANCRTEFTCTRKDMTESHYNREPGRFIACPLCSKDVWMSQITYSFTRYSGGQPMNNPGV